jgi:hypothetical protein
MALDPLTLDDVGRAVRDAHLLVADDPDEDDNELAVAALAGALRLVLLELADDSDPQGPELRRLAGLCGELDGSI